MSHGVLQSVCVCCWPCTLNHLPYNQHITNINRMIYTGHHSMQELSCQHRSCSALFDLCLLLAMYHTSVLECVVPLLVAYSNQVGFYSSSCFGSASFHAQVYTTELAACKALLSSVQLYSSPSTCHRMRGSGTCHWRRRSVLPSIIRQRNKVSGKRQGTDSPALLSSCHVRCLALQ